MTDTRSASRRITDEVTSWPGVTAGPGRRGEFAFKIGPRALGHLHGDRVAHLSFPKDVWQRLYDEGRVDYHPVFPGKPGPASRRIENDDVILEFTDQGLTALELSALQANHHAIDVQVTH